MGLAEWGTLWCLSVAFAYFGGFKLGHIAGVTANELARARAALSSTGVSPGGKDGQG